MLKHIRNCVSSGQQGIALPIIMVILVLAALVTIYTTTTSVKEQQVTADQYRSEQAFATAQAGVYAGVERHNNFESIPNPVNDISSGFTKGSYIVKFCDIWDDDGAGPKTSEEMMQDFLADKLICTNPLSAEDEADGFANDTRVGILSVGRPDDASGRRTITVVSAPGFKVGGGPPGPPLTARGSIGITGNITLINRYSNITLWLGEFQDFGSAAVSTYIKPPDTANDWPRESMIYIPNSTPPNADIMDDVYNDSNVVTSAVPTSNQSSGQNADALTEDANLSKLDPGEMFKKVFSSDKVTVRELAKKAGQYYTDVNNIPTEQTGLIWLQPTATGTISLGRNMGKFDTPAFLIVELQNPSTDVFKITTGGTEVYGMVFVFGNADLKGSPKIYGSMMITEDVAKGAGGGTIAYDPASLKSLPEGPAGLRGIEPGTWKDWGYVK